MQAVAREMNLSETAFVVPRADGSYDLRWFTPTVEVDLCGHATLASAHVLGGAGTFHTRSGELRVHSRRRRLDRDGLPRRPAPPPSPPRPTLHGALGLDDRVGRCAPSPGPAPTCWWSWPAPAPCAPCAPTRRRWPRLGSRCVIVTAAGDRPGVDCVSRVFAPNEGIPEDPVTGSAHCTLAGYWGERSGGDELVGEQASARGGVGAHEAQRRARGARRSGGHRVPGAAARLTSGRCPSDFGSVPRPVGRRCRASRAALTGG